MPATRHALTTARRSRGDTSTSIKAEPTPSEQPSTPPSKALTKSAYPARKTEQGVFLTDPYSAHIKPHWRYKDEAIARQSAEEIWAIFGAYRAKRDFVGMDMSRKFLQMGRTRSLRYALRPGGRKYAKADAADSRQEAPAKKEERGAGGAGRAGGSGEKGERGAEIPRSGEVCDPGKLAGAQIFEEYWLKCWDDPVYLDLWSGWGGSKISPKLAARIAAEVTKGERKPDAEGAGVKVEDEELLVKMEPEEEVKQEEQG